MSTDVKTDASAEADMAKQSGQAAGRGSDLSDTDLATVTGGVKPWLDPNREPDTAIFYTVERKI